MENILFTKVRNVKSPSRAYGEIESVAAGTDFFIPEYTEQFKTDLENKNTTIKPMYLTFVDHDKMTITLFPHGRINIPSGIKVVLPHSTCLVAENKSGVAAKLGLVVGACVIDEDYHGEIHLNVINTSDEPVVLTTGMKLVQFLHLPVMYSPYQEVNTEDYEKLSVTTARGSGGFGSSGN